MDIMIDRKKKRGKSDPISEKSLKDRPTEDLKENLKIPPPDLEYLTEADYNDPDVKQWVEEHHQASLAKYGRLSAEVYERIVIHKERIRTESPSLSHNAAFDLAYERVTGKEPQKRDPDSSI